MSSDCTKTLVSPIGVPIRPYVVTCHAAERPSLFRLNRYPRQAIGFTVRLPRGKHVSGRDEHYYLSFIWAKPARWWK